jgi:hypothetical protein
MIGDLVVTKYDGGCLRSILIRANGIKTGEIPELYQRCGAAAEDRHAAYLKGRSNQFLREVVLRAPLSSKVEYSGRADFVVEIPNVGTVVDECKGHTSKDTRRSVIRNGEYNVGYLAQLVSYMVRLRTQKGRLICGYYEEDENGEFVCQEQRFFKVEIDDEGSIIVDEVSSGYCVADLLAHQRAAVRVLENQEVAQRPDKASLKFGGPCSLCPFKSACDAYDKVGGTTEELLQAARRAVAELPPKPEPKAFKVKQPRKRKAQ